MNEVVVYTIKDLQQILRVSKNIAYELCNSGEIKAIRVGKSIRITKAALDEYLNLKGDNNG